MTIVQDDEGKFDEEQIDTGTFVAAGTVVASSTVAAITSPAKSNGYLVYPSASIFYSPQVQSRIGCMERKS